MRLKCLLQSRVPSNSLTMIFSLFSTMKMLLSHIKAICLYSVSSHLRIKPYHKSSVYYLVLAHLRVYPLCPMQYHYSKSWPTKEECILPSSLTLVYSFRQPQCTGPFLCHTLLNFYLSQRTAVAKSHPGCQSDKFQRRVLWFLILSVRPLFSFLTQLTDNHPYPQYKTISL